MAREVAVTDAKNHVAVWSILNDDVVEGLVSGLAAELVNRKAADAATVAALTQGSNAGPEVADARGGYATLGEKVKSAVFDVRDYGAVGNGVTNDTAAIQAAIAASVGKGVVSLPGGSYLVSGSPALTIPADGVVLRGHGAVIVYAGTGAVIANSSAASVRRNFSISGLTIDTRTAGAGHRALELENFYRGVFRDLILNGTGATGTGVKFIGGTTRSTYYNTFINVSITAGTACIDLGDLCNGSRFFGGVLDGAGIAVKIAPITSTCDTALFAGVAMSTSNATIIQLGGSGATAADCQFVNCRVEVTAAANFNFASGQALRNLVFGGSWSTLVTFVVGSESDANAFILPTAAGASAGIRIDGANAAPWRTIDLRSVNAGITLGNDAAVNWYRRTASIMHTDAKMEATGNVQANHGATLSLTLNFDQILQQGTAADASVRITPKGAGSIVLEGPVRLLSTSGPQLRAGTGTPEGAVTAPVGSLFLRTDGGAATTLYIKETGTGVTGWVAK